VKGLLPCVVRPQPLRQKGMSARAFWRVNKSGTAVQFAVSFLRGGFYFAKAHTNQLKKYQ